MSKCYVNNIMLTLETRRKQRRKNGGNCDMWSERGKTRTTYCPLPFCPLPRQERCSPSRDFGRKGKFRYFNHAPFYVTAACGAGRRVPAPSTAAYQAAVFPSFVPTDPPAAHRRTVPPSAAGHGRRSPFRRSARSAIPPRTAAQPVSAPAAAVPTSPAPLLTACRAPTNTDTA